MQRVDPLHVLLRLAALAQADKGPQHRLDAARHRGQALWLLLPASAWGQTIAVVLFRYFDAAKPGPVRWADRQFKGFGCRGGLGIMLDDLVAAFCTLMVIALWRWWF